jgi:hypothetical protein
MDTRASRYAIWKLHATPSREADINPNPQKGGYPAPDRVTFLTSANRDFPNWRRQAHFTTAVFSGGVVCLAASKKGKNCALRGDDAGIGAFVFVGHFAFKASIASARSIFSARTSQA